MKYESSILKRLIDTYGVIGNPRYLSEIIKEFIVRGKELYPQLFTYQSDWLAHIDEFGLTPEYTVSYTGQHIYAPNTKEKPVKSAILKGCTSYRDIDTGEILETFEEGRNLELVSVRMPVLTTTGKNLFNEDMLTSNFIKNEEGRYIVNGSSAVSGASFAIVNIDATKIYTITVSCTTDSWCNLLIKYKNGETTTKAIGNKTASVTTMYSDKYEVDYIVAYGSSDTYVYDIQIEEGTTATPYEPYKSNILTVNEDVTLRANGSVYDELDLLTGKLTQRIDEDGEVLAKEVIKTVDLTIHDKDHQKVERLTSFEGGTHFDTSSQTGSVLPTLEVDVVVDLEETLMMCSTEGNTM